MARFRCRSCGKECTFVYDPERYMCPICGSIDVQFAVHLDELPANDPLLNVLNSSPNEDDERNEV